MAARGGKSADGSNPRAGVGRSVARGVTRHVVISAQGAYRGYRRYAVNGVARPLTKEAKSGEAFSALWIFARSDDANR